jgi:hypothetical protein
MRMTLTRDFRKTVVTRIERDPSFARARLDEIELARVRRAMDAFMQQRRPPSQIRSKVDLGFRVIEQRPPDEKRESPIAKATYVKSRRVWRVFWHRRDLKWHGYEPKPVVKSVEEFASLVAEDAHACFFG